MSERDPRIWRFNRLLDAAELERLRVEDRSAVMLYGLFERVREAIYARLVALEDVMEGDSYTASYLAAVLGEVNAEIERLKGQARGHLRGWLESGFATAHDQTMAELAVFFDHLRRGPASNPKLPTRVLSTIIEARTQNLDQLFTRLQQRLTQQIRLAAAENLDHQDAARRAARAANEARWTVAEGLAMGQGHRAIARKLAGPGTGEFVRLSYKDAILIVRTSINDAYNEGHVEQLRAAAVTVPGLRQRWCAALVRSTRVCLGLHGQTAAIGGTFKCGAWEGTRPPAIGAGAVPAFHLCRSRVVPDHPDWPENPRLAPLTRDEIEYYASGGGARPQDVARPKRYPGFTPLAPQARADQRAANRATGA